MTITIDHAAIDAWANDPNGQIARELEFVTANDVYWINLGGGQVSKTAK